MLRRDSGILAGYAERVQKGEDTFGRYPENLLQSRVRYSKAFKVGPFTRRSFNKGWVNISVMCHIFRAGETSQDLSS